MRTFEVVAAMLVAVASGTSSQGQEVSAPVDVTVYVTGASLLSSAENQAVRATVSEMFARASVHIAWRDGKPKSGEAVVARVVVSVQFVRQSFRSHTSGALGYALPYADGVKTIILLCDRIQLAAGSLARERRLLAHVLAHEIGHVLQGTNRHAETGVMKARWDCEDFKAMERNPLEFTSTDVNLIRKGLNGSVANGASLSEW